jgi:acetyl-CoA acyltransferase
MTSSSIQTAYIVAAQRLPVGRKGGVLAQARPDALAGVPGLGPARRAELVAAATLARAHSAIGMLPR